MTHGTAIATALITLALSTASAQSPSVRIRVTQRDLVARCLNGATVNPGTRAWELPPGSVTLAFTMRARALPGQSVPVPGTAEISFTSEGGHRYEVEVRADPTAYSTRAWTERAWMPVVRDRTTDRLVSSDPVWRAGGCKAAS